MTTRERLFLWFSLALSVGIWSGSYGLMVGTIFTFSLLFHEYGHYYWMGREGIKDKTMMMMPPLGAIAIAREPWPSLGAETRLALAGPGFGLVSAGILFLLGIISGNYDIKIATFMVCLFNLLNLWLPIAVLDGGRVIKSLLLSINTKLGIGFYPFSCFFLSFLVFSHLSIFMLVLGFLIFIVLKNDFSVTKHTIAAGKLLKMSKQEVVLSISWFLIISAGLCAIVTINGVWGTDFVAFVKNK